MNPKNLQRGKMLTTLSMLFSFYSCANFVECFCIFWVRVLHVFVCVFLRFCRHFLCKYFRLNVLSFYFLFLKLWYLIPHDNSGINLTYQIIQGKLTWCMVVATVVYYVQWNKYHGLCTMYYVQCSFCELISLTNLDCELQLMEAHLTHIFL